MPPIVSKRHLYKFYFSIIFLALFYIALGSAIIFAYSREISEGDVNLPMEAATITFRNKEIRYIFNDMYSNSWEFKYFLKQVVVDKNNYTEKKDLSIESNLAGAGLLWFFLNSYIMYYFKVSNNFFLIRNHNFFWVKKAYRISDIKEIVYETPGNLPNCLRIIIKDYRDKLYPAGTLRDNDWLNLKTTLESHKIKVRNECI